MYPMLEQGVSLGTFKYNGSDDTHYYIENAAGDVFEISARLYNALLKADGTRPINYPASGTHLFLKLRQNRLIHTSRLIKCHGAVNRFILFIFGTISKRVFHICKSLNLLLPAAAILAFVAGLLLKLNVGRFTTLGFCLPLYCPLVLLSIALHEVGHVIAGLAAGYKVTDAGILLLWRIPIGAYVAHEENENVSTGRRLQFALAGVEMNILIAGLLLIVSTISGGFSFTLTMAAVINVLLALINLIPSCGLDGEAALSALLGVNSIYSLSKKWVFSRQRRKKLLRAGLPGLLCFLFFASIVLSRLLIWTLIGVDAFLTIIKVFSL